MLFALLKDLLTQGVVLKKAACTLTFMILTPLLLCFCLPLVKIPVQTFFLHLHS
jgi:hypothetical protein